MSPRSHPEFEPKLVSVLREGYSRRQFVHDLAAGIQVGIVALPLSLALAVASGVRPEQGLFTAVIAGFLISALGGSRVQIGGPTGAFIVLVYGIVQTHGYPGLAIATMMAGGLMILMGFARLGNVIKFVPYPVTVGFTGGIAIIIAVSQVRDLFGLDMTSVPADFVEKIVAYGDHVASVNPWAFDVGAFTVAFLVLWPRVTPRIPAPLLVLVVTTLVVQGFGLSVETIGDRFGAVPQMLPAPSLPSVGRAEIQALFPSAIGIALLALDRVSTLRRSSGRHDGRAASLEHGARRPGGCERGLARLWRHPRDWSDRPHGAQRAERWTNPGGGHGARRHGASDPLRAGAPRRPHSDGGSSGARRATSSSS